MKAITNGLILLKDECVKNKVLVVSEQIMGLFDEVPEKCEVIDVQGAYVSAGLVDIHIHGFAGYDVMDASEVGLQTISDELLKFGVTSYCPTTMTMSKDAILKALECVKKVQANQKSGARILGVNLEGPFISMAYKGAQNPDFIQSPSFELIEPYKDLIKLMTIAPEIEGAQTFIQRVKQETNITVSIGHSSATYDEAKQSVQNGITHATHLFNGMTGLHHRDPGVVGAVLTSSQVKAELIADTIHVNPALFSFLAHTKGPEGLVLITDSMRAGGMCAGTYDLGGQMVIVKDGRACLESGSLAGSVLTLDRAVSNFMTHTTLPLTQVINYASYVPASSIGEAHQIGSLEVGKKADFVIWEPDLTVRQTYVNGECVYSK